MDTEDPCTPPVPCAKEGCWKPFNCPCPDDEACHFAALHRNVPEARPELEMQPHV